ncbi:HAD family hydrolase [Mycobacterium tuberculosis]
MFDKTGTLTVGAAGGEHRNNGRFRHQRARSRGSAYLAAAVESASEHADAAAIVAASPDPGPVNGFVAVAAAVYRGKSAYITLRSASHPGLPGPRPRHDAALVSGQRLDGESRGETVVFVSVDGVVRAALTIADTKDSAAAAVAALRSRGLRTILPTGDTAAADAAAAQVGIDSAVADMLPEGKVDVDPTAPRGSDIPSPWSVTASTTVPRWWVPTWVGDRAWHRRRARCSRHHSGAR